MGDLLWIRFLQRKTSSDRLCKYSHGIHWLLDKTSQNITSIITIIPVIIKVLYKSTAYAEKLQHRFKCGNIIFTCPIAMAYMAISCMRIASSHNYRNSSFIVELAMGQIPHSTERISSSCYY